MNRRMLAIGVACAFVGCDTFRALDSVQRPTAAAVDLGAEAGWDLGADATNAIVADAADDGIDTGPDLPDADVRDADADVDAPDAQPDADMPPTQVCPRDTDAAPVWSVNATTSLTSVSLLTSAPTAGPWVDIAASGGNASEGDEFAVAYRAMIPDPVGRIAILSAVGVTDGVVGDAVIEPYDDITIAAAPTPGEYMYLAVGDPPGCVDFELAAISAIASDGGQGSISIRDIEFLQAPCDEIGPRVALTGPFGNAPNTRLVRASVLPIFEGVRAFASDPTVFEDSVAAMMSARIMPTERDVVMFPSSAFNSYEVWEPFSGRATRIDFDNSGSPEVAWLRDDCYAVAGASATQVRVAPMVCDQAGCMLRPFVDTQTAENQLRVAVAPMPESGFVAVSAQGTGTQRLVARFFDDAFSEVMVGGATDFELVAPQGVYGHFEIATHSNNGDALVAVAYTRGPTSVDPPDTVNVATLTLSQP